MSKLAQGITPEITGEGGSIAPQNALTIAAGTAVATAGQPDSGNAAAVFRSTCAPSAQPTPPPAGK